MPSRRRRRKASASCTAQLLDRRGRPITPWKWLTFPVYFALATGLFVGYNVGLQSHPGTRLWQVGSLGFAILFSFGLAQLATRPFAEMLLKRRARQSGRPGSSQG